MMHISFNILYQFLWQNYIFGSGIKFLVSACSNFVLALFYGPLLVSCLIKNPILRIENHSMFLPLRFRQVDGNNNSWKILLPNTALSFFWEDLGRQHLLEVVVDGADESSSDIYSIDEISDHQPINMTGPGTAIRVTVLKEEKVNVVKITDWMPESERAVKGSQITTSSVPQISGNESYQQPSSDSECEFHVVIELAELGISLIDHTPEEILYLSIQSLLLAYSTGLGSGFSRYVHLS